MASYCYEGAAHDGKERDGNNVRNFVDTGSGGRGPFDELEVKGDVVKVRVDAHGEEADEKRTGEHGPLLHNAGRNSSSRDQF